MLEHKWALQISVAAEAKLVLLCRGPQGVRKRAAMYVVAIGALEQALVDPVPKRHTEVGLRFRVASITERRLFLD